MKSNRKNNIKAEEQAEKELELQRKGVSDEYIFKMRPQEQLDKAMENETLRGILDPTKKVNRGNRFVDDTPYPECLICFQPMSKMIGYSELDIFKKNPQYAFFCPTCKHTITTDDRWSPPYQFGYKVPKHIKKQVDDILLN